MSKKYLLIFICVVFLLTSMGEALSWDWPWSSKEKETSKTETTQQVIYVFESIEHHICNAEQCESKCQQMSSSLSDYMSKGWRVVTATPHEVTIKAWSSDCSTFKKLLEQQMRYSEAMKYDECKCIGKQYVIEK